jgi:hypothetical protein
MKRLLVIAIIFVFVGTANATLWDRGGGLIYDDVLNVTWLQDANYAKTIGYDADRYMNWTQANAWVDQLSYAGYEDWRLPTTVDGPFVWGYDGTTTGGYNITTSELGYMYYVNLNNEGYYDISGNPTGWSTTPNASFVDGNGKLVSIQNLVDAYNVYWSGTEHASNNTMAWALDFRNGNLNTLWKDWELNVWAVRNGDSVAPVPIPSTMLLLGSGLIGLIGFRRKFKK